MYQRRIYTSKEKILKEENRRLKDSLRVIKWSNKNKERKYELNGKWREQNNGTHGAVYLKKYRKIKRLERLLKDYCFYCFEKKIK